MGTSYARTGTEPEHLVGRPYSTPTAGGTTSDHRSVNCALRSSDGPFTAWSRPGHDTPPGQIGLRLADGVLSEVEDGGREHGAGPAGGRPLVEVLEGSDPATRDDRDVDRTAHGLQERNVVAGLRAVPV